MTIGRSRSDRPAKRFSLALIIPTKDRPEQIRDLLRSCGRQTVLPQKILIVDGSRSPLAGIDGEFSSLPVQYIRNSKDTSTTIQKNIGLRHLPPEIDLVVVVKGGGRGRMCTGVDMCTKRKNPII